VIKAISPSIKYVKHTELIVTNDAITKEYKLVAKIAAA